MRRARRPRPERSITLLLYLRISINPNASAIVSVAILKEVWFCRRPAGINLQSTNRCGAMDINSLLSPSESPVTETPPTFPSPPPRASPAKRPGRPSIQQRKSSGLSQVSTVSPIEQSLPSLAVHNAAIAYQNQQGIYGQSATNPPFQNVGYAATTSPPVSGAHSVETRAASSQSVMHRTESTPQMDTLAGTWLL